MKVYVLYNLMKRAENVCKAFEAMSATTMSCDDSAQHLVADQAFSRLRGAVVLLQFAIEELGKEEFEK